MDLVVRKHLTVIIAVTLVGVATGFLCLSFVHDAAPSLDVGMFSTLVFLIPCILMFLGSFVVAATATEIGRQLYLAALVICLVAGIASMVLTSGWMSNEVIAAQLLANSPDGTTIIPILRSPITILRDIAAFIVIPTIGSIFGAWVGSKFHPMRGEASNKKKKKGKK